MSDKKEMKKRSVGIQLLGKNTLGELVAILQVRAKWNSEKNTPETWPGACQVTAHGKLEDGEDFMQALFRETGHVANGGRAARRPLRAVHSGVTPARVRRHW